MKRSFFCMIETAACAGLVAVGIPLSAEGASTAVITNLPPLPNSGYQVNALNQPGQVTGFFFVVGDHGPRAMVSQNGALSDLGTLGGSESRGNAINDSGQVAGDADLFGDSLTHAFLYSGANLVDLGTLGGSASSAAAINSAGQVAGSSLTSQNRRTEAFLYSSGAMTSLGTLGGAYSSAFGINSSGLVIGESSTAASAIHGFVLSAGPMTDIGTLGGGYSSAFAVNDAGMVVGESTTAAGDNHGVAYLGGVLTDMGTLGGTYSSAFVVNQAGQAIGVASTTSDAEFHGFIYSSGTMTDLGTLGGNSSTALSINNHGQVVGESLTTAGTNHAFLWVSGALVDLNTLLPENSGWELSSAQFINDSGRIVGIGMLGGFSQWFVMDLPTDNQPPIAVAGADQTIECQTQVTLDGSQSSDPDGDALTFEWSTANNVLGTSAVLTTSFPIGTTVVTLRVTDIHGASSQDNVSVTVADTTPPTGSCPASVSAPCDANGQAPVPDLVPGIVATDNCTPAGLLSITQSPPAGTLVSVGDHTIVVTVTDASSNQSTCAVTFTVVDGTAPVILSVSANPDNLNPPNHRLVPVTVCVKASDNFDPAPVSRITSVTCSETPDPGDIQITGDLTVTLAASKNTVGESRVYTINVSSTDASNNTSTGSVTVSVTGNSGKGH